MWGKACIGLTIAIILQGLARCSSQAIENDLSNSTDGDSDNSNTGPDPERLSIFESLARLHSENNQLRLDFYESQSQLMALVQDLQEENAKLRQQQNETQTMVLNFVSEMGEELWEDLEVVSEQMKTNVSDKSSEEVVVEEEELMNVVLEMVKTLEDETQNVSSGLDQAQERLASVEDRLLKLEVKESSCSEELLGVQKDVALLMSKLKKVPEKRSFREPVTPRPYRYGTPGCRDIAAPQLVFSVPRDKTLNDDSLIIPICVTKKGKLLTGDFFQNKLNLASLENPGDVEDNYRLHKPWGILELQDGNIAVTSEDKHKIDILSITSDGLKLVKHIPTKLDYYGIAQGPDDSLIVASRKKEPVSSRIDIINMDGKVQRTLLKDVDFLIHPYCLRRFGDDVYVSDWTSGRVFRVNIHTGEANFTIGDLDLSELKFYQPRKFDIDGDGNLYISTGGRVCNPHSEDSFCVIQITHTGSWQVLKKYVGKNGGIFPYGLELTSSQIVISWGSWRKIWFSELVAYTLPRPQEDSQTMLNRGKKLWGERETTTESTLPLSGLSRFQQSQAQQVDNTDRMFTWDDEVDDDDDEYGVDDDDD